MRAASPGRRDGFDFGSVFDSCVERPSYAALLRELWSLLSYRSPRPVPGDLPCGDGRAVLVIPGFLCGDGLTAPLRTALSACGFRAFGWNLGMNWGPTPRLLSGLEARARHLHAQHGPLSLIGISLGGLLARNLAYDRPGDISHVVTVATPLHLPTASTLEPLVRLCARRYSPALDPARLQLPLPVPTTIIYTRDDGIVASESCRIDATGQDAIELTGPHLTLASTPAALTAIVRRLAAA